MKNLKFSSILSFYGDSCSDRHSLLRSRIPKPIPADPAIKIGKLDNGITYYIKENTKSLNNGLN